MLDLLKVLLILGIIIAVLWFLPPTHRLIIQFYEENVIVKTIVDIFGNVLKGFGNAIVQLVKK